MKLEFDSLEIHNFKCFGGGGEGVTFGTLGPGLIFLRGRNEVEPRLGSNGAGKSSLWDAFTWCLFGKTVGGLRNPDVKPRSGKGQTGVLVKVLVDGEPHSIDRTAFPNHLLIDGSEVGQEQVDALLGISFETFTHTILLGQGRPLFFDLAPRDKMQLFSDVLGLERWETRSALANDRARALTAKRAELEGEMAGTEQALKQVEDQLQSSRESMARWEEERRTRQDKAELELAGINKRVSQAGTRYDELELIYDGAETELGALAMEQEKITLSQLKFEHRKLSGTLANETGICPSCGQKIKGSNAEQHRAKLTKEIAALDKKVAKQEQVVDALTAAFNKFQSASRSAKQEMDIILPELSGLKARQEQLRLVVDERREEANPFREQIKQAKATQVKVRAQIKELGAAVKATARSAARAAWWVKGFKDVQLYVIDEVLQELELNTNSVLEDVGLIGWAVRYSVEKETKSGTTKRGLTVEILSPGIKEPVKWESWSGGEGQRLRVIGALALSETLLNHAGVATNLEILDEPTQHLSSEGVRDIVEALAARAEALERQVWYVDHQSVESASFASVVTITRDSKGAHVAF